MMLRSSADKKEQAPSITTPSMYGPPDHTRGQPREIASLIYVRRLGV